jgi:hypothetical protein
MPRFALQAELYGLTQNQRNQGATAINSAFDSGKVVGDVVVDANKTSRHGALLFVESNFDSRAEGDRIFAVCPGLGEHSQHGRGGWVPFLRSPA